MLNKILGLADNKDITPISGLDAAFLYGETPTSPMHIGSVAIIEGSLKFDTFNKCINAFDTLTDPLMLRFSYWQLKSKLNIFEKLEKYHFLEIQNQNQGNF